MTGPEHYREAERLLAMASDIEDWEAPVAQAQAHFTAALAAAAAFSSDTMPKADWDAWRKTCGEGQR